MKQKELFKLLDGIQEQGEETVKSERILMIDGLNLFFRNFAVMNMVNPRWYPYRWFRWFFPIIRCYDTPNSTNTGLCNI